MLSVWLLAGGCLATIFMARIGPQALMPNLQARKHKKKDTTAILFAMWNWRRTQLVEANHGFQLN
jgi:hypothetical protein